MPLLPTGAPWPWRLLEGQAHDPIQADFHPVLLILDLEASDGRAGMKRPTVCDRAEHKAKRQGQGATTALPMVGLEELTSPPFALLSLIFSWGRVLVLWFFSCLFFGISRNPD